MLNSCDLTSIADEASNFFKNILHAKSVSGAIAEKDQGVHTVFADFDNTKIQVNRVDLNETKVSFL